MENWRRELYLAHHGIKGQKWGVRRGPPYPLGQSKTRRVHVNVKSSEKVVGRIDKRSIGSYNSSERLAKAAKIGAVVALTGLALYGAHKAGYLDSAKIRGEAAIRRIMAMTGPVSVDNIAGSLKQLPSPESKPVSKPKQEPAIRDPKTGFKIVHESLSDSLKNANTLKGTLEGSGNCTYSAIAGFLRSQGYDVVAKGTGGKGQDLGGILEKAFKGVQLKEGQGGAIPRSPDDAAKMLKKRFGDNASGVIMLTWKAAGDPSHAFNWVIQDGIVQFLDFQNKSDNAICRNYWNMANHEGSFLFARLDGEGITIDPVAVREYVTER